VVIAIDPSLQSLSMSCNEVEPAYVKCTNITLTSEPLLVLTPKTAKKENIDSVALVPSFNSQYENMMKFPNAELAEIFPKIVVALVKDYIIPSMIFDDSMGQYEGLVFFENKMTSFTSTLTIKNAKITYLTIRNNLLTIIAKDTFKNMLAMQKFSLENNKITSIHSESFKDMKALKNLNIRLNLLKTIQDELIQSLPKKLDLIMDEDVIKNSTYTSKTSGNSTTFQSLSMACEEVEKNYVRCTNITLVSKPFLDLTPKSAKKENVDSVQLIPSLDSQLKDLMKFPNAELAEMFPKLVLTAIHDRTT
jgi:hypothetical protein